MVLFELIEEQFNLLVMSEQVVVYVVLGCDLDMLGVVVVCYWGLGDELFYMI